MFVEPKRKTHKVAFSVESPVILPKHLGKMISKDDLLGSSSSGSTIMTNNIDKQDSLGTASSLLKRSHVSGMSEISDFISDDNLDEEGPMEISQNEDSFHSLTLNKTQQQQPNNMNYTLPPIIRNNLFTTQNFERYMETAMVADSNAPTELNHFDEMFMAPKLKPGLMRRSRSSSPSHSLIVSNMPNRYAGSNLNKVEDWLSQISQEPKHRCPRDGQPDHPRFCKLCMEGKSLAKSF